MIRIGFIVETPATNKRKLLAGGQLSFLSLIDNLKAHDIESYVVVAEKWELTNELEKMGITYLITPIHAIFVSTTGNNKTPHDSLKDEKENEMSLKVIASFFENNKVQIIHINSEFCGVIGAQVAKVLHIPYIFHIREFLKDDFGWRFKYEDESRKLISEANLLIAISEAIHSHLSVLYPLTKIITIYNGVDEKRYSCDCKRFVDEITNIVIVGRVNKYKSQFDAVRAIEYLLTHGDKNYRLKIIGYRETEPSSYEKMLYDYVMENQLEAYIRFLPFTQTVEKELKHCDIGLMCSKKEAFGRVTVEYMMANMLAIGTNSGATPEIITHGIDGYLYEPGDYVSLASLISLARANPEHTNEIIQRGKEKALNTFSCNEYVAKIIGAYNAILDSQ